MFAWTSIGSSRIVLGSTGHGWMDTVGSEGSQ